MIVVILFIIILAGVAGANFWHNTQKQKITACTMEAKLCPDGSAVGRTGPNCEFAACPTTGNSGIKGTVLLGPTCPVERIPPDPQCADRTYKTSFVVTAQGAPTQIIKQFTSGTDGKFSVYLVPGEYAISPSKTASIYPRCSGQEAIQVEKNKYTEITLQCDTGIR